MIEPLPYPRLAAVLAALRRRRWGMAFLFAAVSLSAALAAWVAPRTYRFEASVLYQFAQPRAGDPTASAEMAGFLRTQKAILLSDAVLVPAMMKSQGVAASQPDGAAEHSDLAGEIRNSTVAHAERMDRLRKGLRVELPRPPGGATGVVRIRLDLAEDRAGLWGRPSFEQTQYQGQKFLVNLLMCYRARRETLDLQRQEIALKRLDESPLEIAFEDFRRTATAIEDYLAQARQKEIAKVLDGPALTAMPPMTGPGAPGADLLDDVERFAQRSQAQRLLREAEGARMAYEQAIRAAAQARRQIQQDPMIVQLLDGPRLSQLEPVRPRSAAVLLWGLLAAAVAAGMYFAMAEGLRFLRGVRCRS